MKSSENNEAVEKYLEEQFFLDWWYFKYANRHLFHLLLSEGSVHKFYNEVFLWLESVASEYTTIPQNGELPENEYYSKILALSNCLVYGYHKLTRPNDPPNKRYERLLKTYDYPLEKLTDDDVEFVKFLYRKTQQYGYLIVPLCLMPDPEICWNAFVEEVPCDFNAIINTPLYTYRNKHRTPNGLRITSAPVVPGNDSTWDLAIYCNESDVPYHLNTKIDTLWEVPGRQEVGNKHKCQSVIYVTRRLCSRRAVSDAIGCEIDSLHDPAGSRALWLNLSVDSLAESIKIPTANGEEVSIAKALEENSNLSKHLSGKPSASANQAEKRYKKKNKRTIKQQRFNDPRLKKKWDLEEDNLRRTIGLYHWDKAHESGSSDQLRKPMIKETIKRLREVKPDVLDLYYRGFNQPILNSKEILGDEPGVRASVVEMMEADYTLTDECIKQVEYLRPYEARKARMKQKK